MSARVEFIYDPDCPNVLEARQALLRAFAELNITAKWMEWSRSSPESPPYARQYGSPTILVNGLDVTGTEPLEEANCCRVYSDGPAGLRGVPAVSSIVVALRHNEASAPEAPSKRLAGRWHSLTALPGVGAAFLPVGGCPACWPVYSGILASLGLTFLLDSAYVLWITSALLCAALFALAFRAKARRRYGPLILGAISIGMVLLFKFAWMIDAFVYVGLSGFVIASSWNAWPRKPKSAGVCPGCASTVR